MRLSPYYPNYYLYGLGHAQYLSSRYDEAIAAFKLYNERAPDNPGAGHILLAAIYGQRGRVDLAKAEIAKALERSPHFTVKLMAKIHPYRHDEDLTRLLDALRKAGLPE